MYQGELVESSATQFVGAPHPQPSDPASVKILRAEPMEPHDRLRHVVDPRVRFTRRARVKPGIDKIG
jgi:hypothetical protein